VKLRRIKGKTTIELTSREVLDLYLILYSYLDGPDFHSTPSGVRRDRMAARIKDFVGGGKAKA